MNTKDVKVSERNAIVEAVSKSRPGIWDKPVSRKYYEELRQRVMDIVSQLNPRRAQEWSDMVMTLVDAYIDDPRMDPESFAHTPRECDLIFYTLRADISRAVERSLRARSRAQARRSSRHANAPTTQPSLNPAPRAAKSSSNTQNRDTTVSSIKVSDNLPAKDDRQRTKTNSSHYNANESILTSSTVGAVIGT